jgi:hypothetical protein
VSVSNKLRGFERFSPQPGTPPQQLSEELKDDKTDKSRITANFYCNADGSYKLDIFFIVKVFRPRAFKGI